MGKELKSVEKMFARTTLTLRLIKTKSVVSFPGDVEESLERGERARAWGRGKFCCMTAPHHSV